MQEDCGVTKNVLRVDVALVADPLAHAGAHLIEQVGDAEEIEDGNAVGFAFDFDIIISAGCSAGYSGWAAFFGGFSLGGSSG